MITPRFIQTRDHDRETIKMMTTRPVPPSTTSSLLMIVAMLTSFALGCVDHRPIRNGVMDESNYVVKSDLTQPNPKPNSKPIPTLTPTLTLPCDARKALKLAGRERGS